MPRSSTPSRGVAQMTTANQRARMSQAPVATSTPESSSRHSSQNASGAAIPASAATLGRIAASLRAVTIAFSAEVSVSTIQSHADVASAPSTSSRQRPWSCRGEAERSRHAGSRPGRARRYVTSRGAIRDNAREPGPATASFVTYGKGHALFAWTVTRSIRDNAPLPLIGPFDRRGRPALRPAGSRAPHTATPASSRWTSSACLRTRKRVNWHPE